MAQSALKAASQKLQQASARFQGGLVERMQLKARVDDCMTRHCDPFKSRAEAIAERLGLDAGKQSAPTPADYIDDPETLVNTKTWTMSEVMEYHTFEDCF